MKYKVGDKVWVSSDNHFGKLFNILNKAGFYDNPAVITSVFTLPNTYQVKSSMLNKVIVVSENEIRLAE